MTKEHEGDLARMDSQCSPSASRTAPANEVVPSVSELIATLTQMRNAYQDAAALVSCSSGNYKAGSGGWWELHGYADILDEAIPRIRRHRARTEGIDRQIERARVAKAEGLVNV
jgi:hypothetical protein